MIYSIKITIFQTLQEELTGAVFHPLDDNLMITHGKGHLTFWNRRKDGFFERTDIIKPVSLPKKTSKSNKKFQPSRTLITALQFEQDGDVITADSDGFITIYSVDSDGAYFVRLEYEAHIKGVSSLVMLSEGTLLSGGDKDRKIVAWDSLQNYKKITETKVEPSFNFHLLKAFFFSLLNLQVELDQSILNVLVVTMVISTSELPKTTFLKVRSKEGSIRLFLDTEDSYGDSLCIPMMKFSQLQDMIKILRCGGKINLFGFYKYEQSCLSQINEFSRLLLSVFL